MKFVGNGVTDGLRWAIDMCVPPVTETPPFHYTATHLNSWSAIEAARDKSGNDFLKPSLPINQYVSTVPLPCKKKSFIRRYGGRGN